MNFNFLKRKSVIIPKEEESYKTIIDNSSYIDKLINKLEKENEELKQELKNKSEEVAKLLNDLDKYRERIRIENNNKEDVELLNIITSPMEARLALETASKDKSWMKTKINERHHKGHEE